MKWLPKEKQNPFILVVVITAAILMLICFGLLRSQSSILARVVTSRKAAEVQLQGIEKTVKNADSTTNDLATVTAALSPPHSCQRRLAPPNRQAATERDERARRTRQARRTGNRR